MADGDWITRAVNNSYAIKEAQERGRRAAESGSTFGLYGGDWSPRGRFLDDIARESYKNELSNQSNKSSPTYNYDTSSNSSWGGALLLVFIGIVWLISTSNGTQNTSVSNAASGNASQSASGLQNTSLSNPISVTANQSASGLGRINPTEGANLRVSAGTHSKSIAKLKSGTVVVLLGSSEAVEGSIWVRVRVEDITGWIRKDLIRLSEKIQVGSTVRVSKNVTEVAIRHTPGLGKNNFNTVKSGDILTVIAGEEIVNDLIWWKVQIGNQQGWIAEYSMSKGQILEPIDK